MYLCCDLQLPERAEPSGKGSWSLRDLVWPQPLGVTRPVCHLQRDQGIILSSSMGICTQT